MAPYEMAVIGKFLWYVIFFCIGLGFGAVLEMSGFGDTRKLAAQFYLKEMTVLKVMFTAIITAATLIHLCSAVGILDFSMVWVNHTYLVPGIVGGFIMGIGFIIGGFCPGTSIVAVSTLKIDGMFFALGTALGVFAFGETVHLFEDFWNSSYMGRFTLPEWLGLSEGVVLLGVIFMALLMFYGGEICEKIFGQKVPVREIDLRPRHRCKITGAAVLILLAVVTIFAGTPTGEEKWRMIEPTEGKKLEAREVYIHPGELVELMHNATIYLDIIDVRSEDDFNLFHLRGSKNMTLTRVCSREHVRRLLVLQRREIQDDKERICDPKNVKKLVDSPSNTVVVLASNDEAAATQTWKMLKSSGVVNLYILDGGVNHWLSIFPVDPGIARKAPEGKQRQEDSLRYLFSKSVGDTVPSARPDIHAGDYPALKYESKVKMKSADEKSGGCG